MKAKGFISGLAGGVIGAALLLGGNYLLTGNTSVPNNNNSSGTAQVSNINYNVTDGVTQAVDKVKTAVVSVINLQPQQRNSGQLGSLFGGSSTPSDDDGELQPAGEGSGVIFKKHEGKAYIVTNNHVIAEQQGLEVQLSNGKRVKAELVGADSFTDLAVLTIPEEDVDNVATFANSDDIQIGEPAIAIGSPLGTQFANTVTSGIVSATGRTVTNQNDQNQPVEINAIQTDAAINPGNSGGALVNIAGQVIGINSSKIVSDQSGSTGVEGIGFAIPSNDVVNIVNQLIEHGRIERPGIGVTTTALSNLTTSARTELNLPDSVTNGVIVMSTIEGWPAAEAGLKEYDVITQVNDTAISSPTALQTALFRQKVGDTVTLTFYRDGKEQTAQMTLSKQYSDLPSNNPTRGTEEGD